MQNGLLEIDGLRPFFFQEQYPDSISFARWVWNDFIDVVTAAISGFVFEMIKAFDTVTSKRNQKMNF